MNHHFSLNPRTILGVSIEATADEIRDAFREKSKKHHPDLGGDEWAFRMVLRAYEVLKSTANGLEAGGGGGAASPGSNVDVDVDVVVEAQPWMKPSPHAPFFAQKRFRFGAEATDEAAEGPSAGETPTQTPPPGVFQTVEVELIWIRFEMVESAAAAEASDGTDRATLSVCMVVSWPMRSLVARAAEYSDLGETLRSVIDAFEYLQNQSAAVAVRSRIEDGQFVGWVSFPDVVTAQSGFLVLRDNLAQHNLSVRLQTRDELIPQGWVV